MMQRHTSEADSTAVRVVVVSEAPGQPDAETIAALGAAGDELEDRLEGLVSRVA
jgi:hypothetical protein